MQIIKFAKRLTIKIIRIIRNVVKAVLFEAKFSAYHDWEKNSYSSPSPQYIKQACVLRNSLTLGKKFIFIESGTYLGDTAAILGPIAEKVVSLEPEFELYKKACLRFKESSNIEIINGTSEDVFPILIPKLTGDVCFWLDGHFSAGVTYKGKSHTPIIEELNEIGKNLLNLRKVVIMVDDVRCFDPSIAGFEDYPTRNYLVDWANKNELAWTIEHDIFIAKN